MKASQRVLPFKLSGKLARLTVECLPDGNSSRDDGLSNNMKTIQFKRFRVVAIICLGATLAQAAYAQEQAPNKDAWEFRIGYPLWAAGVKGTVGVGGREAHVNDDFWDLLDTLDFTTALNLEIRK